MCEVAAVKVISAESVWLDTLHFRRKAVSTIIGGIVILTLFLSAFTAMVMIGKQYDTYQGLNYGMNQEDINRFSENLTAVYPGLIQISPSPCTTCQYDMLVSNQGGMAIQIVQLYINTTFAGTAGCTFAPPIGNIGQCILNPVPPSNSPANFMFSQNDAYINAGEFNHTVGFWLPFSLPNSGLQGPSSPANTVWIVTARGRVFTFQFPFAANALAIPGFTPNLIRGNSKIAWYGSAGTSQTSCHSESSEVRSVPGSVGNLYFLNPWTDPSIIEAAAKKSSPSEFIYVYVRLNNTSGGPLTVSQGTIILENADSGSNQKMYFAGGPYVGAYYPVTSTILTPGTVTIDPLNPGATGGKNGTFIALFQLTTYDQSLFSGVVPAGSIFVGTVAINNQAEDSTYSTLLAFTDGIYARPCTTYSP